MKVVPLFAALLFSLASHAQDDPCPEAILMQKGTTKMNKNPERSGPVEMPVQKKMITAVDAMINANYVPMGVNTKWGGVYPEVTDRMPVAEYHYSTMAFKWSCKEGVPYFEPDETSTGFNIFFNYFDYGIIYDTVANGAREEGFHALRHGMPVEIGKGIWAFPDAPASMGASLNQRSRVYLITYDGKLPWSYVTRKEFLLKRKTTLQLRKEREMPSEKEGPAALRAKLENEFALAMEKLDNQLNAPESELNKPAVVIKSMDNNYDYSFTDTDERFAKILIKPNPSYFIKYSQRSVPQFITVSIDWASSNRTYTKYANDMIKAIDLDFLKTQIGKSTPPVSPSFKANAYAAPGKGIGSVDEDYIPEPVNR